MRSWALGTFIALAGCAALQPGADQVMAVDRIEGEAIAAGRAPAAEQKAALTRAQQAYAADASPLNRLRYATLLATLPAPLRDEARATELLEPIADVNAAGVGRFAAFLAAQLAERQRLARESDRVAKERANADKERDKREEALRQQLEALRAIERGILEREENLRRRQR